MTTTVADAYKAQLVDLSGALAAARIEELSEALAGGNAEDVFRYLVNTFGERKKTLLEELAFVALAKLPEEARRKELLAALELPYPYVRYLALKTLADVRDRTTIAVLVANSYPATFAGDSNYAGSTAGTPAFALGSGRHH